MLLKKEKKVVVVKSVKPSKESEGKLTPRKAIVEAGKPKDQKHLG